MKSVILSFALWLGALGAQAQGNIEILMGVLAGLAEDPAFEQELVSLYQVEPPASELLVAHGKAMLGDPRYQRYLAEAMSNKMSREGVPDPNEIRQVYREFGASLSQNLALSGLGRLELPDQRRFLEYTKTVTAGMGEEACGKAVLRQLSALELALAEAKAYNRVPRETLEGYFALLRKAVFAEIDENPARQILSVSDDSAAQADIDQTIQARLSAHPEGTRMIAALSTPGSTDYAALCDFSGLIFDGILGLDGPAGDRAVRKMIAAMAP